MPGGGGPPHAGPAHPAAPGGQWRRCLAVERGGVCRVKGIGGMQMYTH